MAGPHSTCAPSVRHGPGAGKRAIFARQRQRQRQHTKISKLVAYSKFRPLTHHLPGALEANPPSLPNTATKMSAEKRTNEQDGQLVVKRQKLGERALARANASGSSALVQTVCAHVPARGSGGTPG